MATATATILVTKQFTLELNEQEAEFLRDLLQNSAIEDEPVTQNTMRKSLFYALREALSE